MLSSSPRYKSATEIEENSISFIGSLAVLWLLIPYLIFVIKCYEFYLVIPTILVVSYFFIPTFNSLFNPRTKISIPTSCIIVAIISAIFFVWLSGLLPPLGMARDFDKHFAIMNLLADSQTWPPTFNHAAGNFGDKAGEYFLRYNTALYIVPAILQKLIPLGTRYWLALYEIIGLTIFFICLAYSIFPSLKNIRFLFFKSFLCFFIFMGFSGLDIIGSVYASHSIDLGTHLEWWAGGFSFSSMVTVFDWAPQHCMPAWLGVALLYLNTRKKGIVLQESMFLLLLLIFFWSPLVLVGVLLLFPIYAKESIDLLKKRKHIAMCFLMFLILLLPIILYFKAGTVDIPKKLLWNPLQPTQESLTRVFTFLFLEVYIYIAFLLILSRNFFTKLLLINLAIIFLMCTIFHIGYLNDFALKASLPPLALVAMLVIHSLIAEHHLSISMKVIRVLLLTTYIVGLITPIYETIRGYKDMRYNLSTSNMKDHEKEWWWIQYVSPMEDKPFFISLNPDPIKFELHH